MKISVNLNKVTSQPSLTEKLPVHCTHTERQYGHKPSRAVKLVLHETSMNACGRH